MKHIDGWLYAGVAACMAAVDMLDGDSAKNLFPAEGLFIALFMFKVTGATLMAGKAYRSTTFKTVQEQDQAASGAPQAVPMVATMQPTTVEPVTASPASAVGIIPDPGSKVTPPGVGS